MESNRKPKDLKDKSTIKEDNNNKVEQSNIKLNLV